MMGYHEDVESEAEKAINLSDTISPHLSFIEEGVERASTWFRKNLVFN